MNRRRGKAFQGAGRDLCLATVAFALFNAASPAAAEVGSPKTLTRFHDPVIVRTSALAPLPQHGTAGLRLVRFEAGALVPIPFQFDARDRGGNLVIPGESDFVFDENDELVFMAKDTGARATPEVFPETADAALEIEVVDPVTDERGWAYLLHYRGTPPPRISEPYVTYDAITQQARSAFYEVTYAPSRNYFTGMRITPEAGGSGENLLRQTRMRGRPTFSLLLGKLSLSFTERSSIVEIDGVRSGPVRAVRRVRLSIDLGPMFPDLPNGTVYTHHYLSSFTTPTRISVPWLALAVLRDFEFENVVDLRREAMPMQYWDAANPQGLMFTSATPVPVETTRDHDWWAASGSAGTFLQAFVVPKKWTAWGITRGTVFRNTASDGRTGKAEEARYAAGYSLLHMTNLREAGDYRLRLATIILPKPYQAGDEIQPMAMLTRPVRTAVHLVR